MKSSTSRAVLCWPALCSEDKSCCAELASTPTCATTSHKLGWAAADGSTQWLAEPKTLHLVINQAQNRTHDSGVQSADNIEASRGYL